MLSFAALAISAMASVETLPVKVVDGKKYHYYTVQPKESLYSLSHKFGISRDDILKYNPGAVDGLKAYEDLLFPVEEKNSATSSVASPEYDGSASTYEVKRGDTVYGICRRFGIDRDEFLRLNPGAVDGLKTGETIYLRDSHTAAVGSQRPVAPAAEQQQPVQQPVSSNGSYYVIKEHETLYHIAKTHGITVEAILDANPDLDVTNYGAGTRIFLPGSVSADEPSLPDAPAPVIMPDTSVVSAQRISIAVALPFNLYDEKAARQDKVYTEFYKGFLLAVDSMRHCGTPIRIMAFDTSNSLDSVNKILANPMLSDAQVIIAPGDAQQLLAFADYGKAHNIPVLNLFHVKDISYRINPSMMQANIPHDKMYEKAADYLINSLRGATPVFIKSRNCVSDKAEFIGVLQSRFNERGFVAQELVFDETLKKDDLETFDTAGSYMFIPVTGKLEELNKMLPALIEFKNENVMPDGVRMFGYPEWTTFRGDTFSKMSEVGTTVFSRFYTVPEDAKLKQVEDVFTKWYGAPMALLVPRQGLFGFDTGMYLINALKSNGGDFDRFTPSYDGVQNGFDFLRSPGGGYVNNELYIINFRPDGAVDKLSL